MDRHTRQARLSDVGAAGQARIARAVVLVPAAGLAAEIAARYLAGAGVAEVRVGDEGAARAARAVDACVRVTVAAGLTGGEPPEADEVLRDPSARAVAAGARLALRALRRALASEDA